MESEEPFSLSIISVILGAPRSTRLYMLFVYNGVRCLVGDRKGRILLCRKRKHCQRILDASRFRDEVACKIPDGVELALDVPRAVELIRDRDVDDAARILNVLNTLTDCLEAVGARLPEPYRAAVWPFADHLTFNREYGSYFRENKGSSRQAIIDAVFWCVGCVSLRSRIV